jgi:hypothetical protein
MASFFMSERFQRALPWIAGLLLVAGVVAVLTVRATDDKGEEARPAANAQPAQPAVVDTQPEGRRGGKVERAARVTAGEFILAAAGRENLKKAWALSHPELRDQCACSYKQWLTGNIPIPYYPVGNIERAAFSVDEVTPNRTSLLVALLPKEGAKVKGQTFWIELKKTKQGKKQRWLVNYFQPYAPDTAGTPATAG